MMFLSIKQHLINIWSSIHEKVKQHWGWVEKKRCLQKHVFVLDEILDEILRGYSHSRTFIQNVSSNILKFKILKVYPLNNSKWRT